MASRSAMQKSSLATPITTMLALGPVASGSYAALGFKEQLNLPILNGGETLLELLQHFAKMARIINRYESFLKIIHAVSREMERAAPHTPVQGLIQPAWKQKSHIERRIIDLQDNMLEGRVFISSNIAWDEARFIASVKCNVKHSPFAIKIEMFRRVRSLRVSGNHSISFPDHPEYLRIVKSF
jgi:hypothetical protein